MSLLSLHNVGVDYKKKGRIVSALQDVDFKLGNGEFVTVVGPSGSGKTTFIQVCGGILTPTRGRLFIDGVDLSMLNNRQLAQLRNQSIGFVFQFFNLIGYLTAAENVALPLLFAGVDADERLKRANHMLDTLGLSDRAQHRPSELSGGERQRVGIARALVTGPRLLIADEPTGNLDSDSGRNVMQQLSEIRAAREIAILMVTHDRSLTHVGDRTITIRGGRLE